MTHPHPPARATLPDTFVPAHHSIPAVANRDEPMVWVPAPGGNFIAVPRSTLPADYFTPHPTTATVPAPTAAGVDPRAQLLAAGGVAAAGVGWGAGQFLSAVAGFGTGGLLALALLILAARMRPAREEKPSCAGAAGTVVNVHRGGRVGKVSAR